LKKRDLITSGHFQCRGVIIVGCELCTNEWYGIQLFCFGFLHDSPQRLRKFAMVRTRFMITSLAVHLTRIAVGDCHDGVLFYYYQEVRFYKSCPSHSLAKRNLVGAVSEILLVRDFFPVVIKSDVNLFVWGLWYRIPISWSSSIVILYIA
jgi:hypothetical protein